MLKPLASALLIVLIGTGAWGQQGGTAAQEQRHGGFPIRSGKHALIGLSGAPSHDFPGRRTYGRSTSVYEGWPYFPPEYNEPEVVVETPAPQAAVPVAPAKLEPVPSGVLLELQGNRWVRVSSFATEAPSPSEPQPQSAPKSSAIPAKEIPPTVIVYRDGHSEELTSYSIIGSTIYTKADYWSSGQWTRQIRIADLDIPATLKQNQKRGIEFQLPSGPNEVVLRP